MVCQWVLPTTYQPGFLPSQCNPDPALKRGSSLLFPWVNTMTICALMCQVSNDHLFLLFLWGAHSGHLSGTWLILNHHEKKGGQGGKSFQPHKTSKSLRSCTVGTFLNGNWETKGNFRERSQNTWRALAAKLRGKTPMFTCVVQGEVRHILRVEILVSSEMKAYIQLRPEGLDSLPSAWMPSRSHSQQPQQVSHSVPRWAWEQVCLQNRTWFWKFDWLHVFLISQEGDCRKERGSGELRRERK